MKKICVFALSLFIFIFAGSAQSAQAACEPLPPPDPGEQTATVDSLSELNRAISGATGPKTIFLKSGTYWVTKTNFIIVNKPDITLRSQSGDRDDVVIKGTGMAYTGGVGHGIYVDADNVTIADLTVRDIQNHAIFVNPGCDHLLVHNVRCLDIGEQMLKATGGTAYPPKNHGIVECSLFEYTHYLNDQDDGWYTNGIDILNAHDWIIRDNILKNIRHNPALTEQFAGPAILAWIGSSGTLVERNQLINCDFGISFGNSGGGGVQHQGGIIRNNFVKGYSGSDFGIGLIKATDAKVIHNTVWSPGNWPYSIEARFGETTNVTIKNNFTDEPIFGNRDGASTTLISNSSSAAEGEFVNVAEGDLHLSGDSVSAVDAGAPDPDRNSDIDGAAILDGQPDLGADEWVSQEESGKITGQVILKDSDPAEPIPDVHVGLYDPETDTEILSAFTDVDGRFVFEALSDGRYSIRLEKNGLEDKTLAPFDYQAVNPRDFGAIPMAEGLMDGTIAGRVVILEADGQTSADNVQVELVVEGEESAIDGVFTDSAGGFAFDGVADGSYFLRLSGDGLEPLTLDPFGFEAENPLDLGEIGMSPLPPAGTLSGTAIVKESDPLSPVEGVTVDLFLEGQADAMDSATTDAQGDFRFEGLSDGRYLLSLSKSGFVEKTLDPIAFVASEPQDLGPLPLQPIASQGPAVQGVVSDVDGRPVSGASVILFVTDGSPFSVGSDQSDENGYYFIPEADPEGINYYLQVSKSGFETWNGGDAPFTIGADEAVVRDITLHRFPRIQGTITDSADEPLENALVALYAVGQADTAQITDTTDADGAYEFGPIETLGQYYIVVSKEGYQSFNSQDSPISVALDQVYPKDARLEPVGTPDPAGVEGMVKDGEANPLSDVQIALYTESDQLLGTRLSGADGTFSFADIESEGSHYLRAAKSGFQSHTTDPFDLRFGLVHSLSDIVLEPATDAGTIRGLVTDDSQTPVSGATVQLIPDGQSDPLMSDESNESGEFAFSPVPVGAYHLRVVKTGFEVLETDGFETTEAAPDKTDIAVALVPETSTPPPAESCVQVDADNADFYAGEGPDSVTLRYPNKRYFFPVYPDGAHQVRVIAVISDQIIKVEGDMSGYSHFEDLSDISDNPGAYAVFQGENEQGTWPKFDGETTDIYVESGHAVEAGDLVNFFNTAGQAQFSTVILPPVSQEMVAKGDTLKLQIALSNGETVGIQPNAQNGTDRLQPFDSVITDQAELALRFAEDAETYSMELQAKSFDPLAGYNERGWAVIAVNENYFADDCFPVEPYDGDFDADGMADSCEAEYFGSLEPDPSEDPDDDGVSNYEECKQGTDPTDPDDFPRPTQFESGIFTVGETGKVTVAFLFDGGHYQGELAAFNIAGMEPYVPNSVDFIQEALNRASANDPQTGFVAISDPSEGARFSGFLGDQTDFNQGDYLGIKQFEMEPGTRFAVYLVPNGTVEEVKADPATHSPQLRPLFSLAAANADHNLYLGQVADLFDNDRAYAYEDMVFTSSDFDFDDLIFYMDGASSDIPSLDALAEQAVVPQKPDWLESDLGQQLKAHSAADPAHTAPDRMVIQVAAPAVAVVYDPQDRYIGRMVGSTITGAMLEIDGEGNQTFYLPYLETGDYRVVLTSEAAAEVPVTVSQEAGGEPIGTRTLDLGLEVDGSLEMVIPGTADGDLKTIETDPEANTAMVEATAGLYGTITPSGTTVVEAGTSPEFVIQADEGAVISQVLVDQTAIAIAEGQTEYRHGFDAITGAHEIHAMFELEESALVTVTVDIQGAGEVSPSEGDLSEGSVRIPAGTDLILAANPAQGFEFEGWSGDIQCADAKDDTAGVDCGDPVLALTEISQDMGLTATFVEKQGGSVFDTGVFTVGESGKVRIDFLFDGGGYRGELGVFNIQGMDAYEPGSVEFIQEAVRRALSQDTQEGFVIISDPVEGARFSGYLGDNRDFNQGPYLGIKERAMEPGTEFAVFLVPNGTVQKLSNNPQTTDPKLAGLFSLASSNPDHGMYMGQVADLFDSDRAFAYEDLVFTNSDFDFDDLIFYVDGASSTIPALDDLADQDIVPGQPAWLGSDLGEAIWEHSEAAGPPEPDATRIVIEISASVTVVITDPVTGQTISMDGGRIPGAFLQVSQGEDGAIQNQRFSLPPLESGEYQILVAGQSAIAVDAEITVSQQTGDGTVIQEDTSQVTVSDQEPAQTQVPGDPDAPLDIAEPETVSTFVNASAGMYGRIEPRGRVVVAEGESPEFTIIAEENAWIQTVTVDGEALALEDKLRQYVHTFDPLQAGAHSIQAQFESQQYRVTITKAGNGEGFLSETTQTVDAGADLVVSANPGEESVFAGWSGDAFGIGDAVLTDIQTDKQLIARFDRKEPDSKLIYASAGDCASIVPGGNVVIGPEDTASFFIIQPTNECYGYDVRVNGQSQGDIRSYPYEDLADGDTIEVVCALKQYQISVQVAGEGSGTVPFTTKTVDCGSNLTLIAQPDADSRFGGWTGDFTGSHPTAELRDIRSDMTLIATFNPPSEPAPPPAPAPVNNPPEADAGEDFTVPVGASVTLDGSASQDPDGEITEYGWEQIEGEPMVALENADSPAMTFVAPADEAELTFKLSVTDDDGASASDSVAVTVTGKNAPPAANAGVDQTVAEGEAVTLDGSNSNDPDDGIARYQWEQTEGEAVELSDATVSQPSFTAPQVDADGASLGFALTVFDSLGQSDTDTVLVNVTDVLVNQAPVAVAGEGQEVTEGETVRLNGLDSFDPDGDPISFAWSQTSGTAVTLSDPEAAAPAFTAPPVGENGQTLGFHLRVTDSGGLQSEAETWVSVIDANIAPTSEAGEGQTVTEGQTVRLDGTASFDPDGQLTAYQWEQTAGPQVTLSDPADPRPGFVAPAVEPEGASLSFSLTVTDDGGLQAGDSVAIAVADSGVPAFPDHPDAVVTQTENGDPIGVETDDNGAIVELETEPPPAAIGDEGAPQTAPLGLIAMTLKIATPGATVEVTLLLADPAQPDETWFALDPESGFTDLSGQLSFSDDRTGSSLSLTDGGTGDQDGQANGRIVLQAVLGKAPAADDDTDGDEAGDGDGDSGISCFIANAADEGWNGVPPGGAVILVLVGMTALWRRRNNEE